MSFIDFPFLLITYIIEAWTVFKKKEWKTSISLELTATLPLLQSARHDFNTSSVKTRMKVLVFRFCAITTHQNISKYRYILITANQKKLVYHCVTMIALPRTGPRRTAVIRIENHRQKKKGIFRKFKNSNTMFEHYKLWLFIKAIYFFSFFLYTS